ncbi:hypothetical protein HDU76_013388 [Blyttiomyces sp. JEL0837]|nr:hypothetical protein HDU76_013388 [Blyttiomyces sp. JEL0837]
MVISIAITLTAIAIYKLANRNNKTPEKVLIASAFPKELQDQILKDYQEAISVFCSHRYERMGKIEGKKDLVIAASSSSSETGSNNNSTDDLVASERGGETPVDTASTVNGDTIEDTDTITSPSPSASASSSTSTQPIPPATPPTPRRSRLSWMTRKPGPSTSTSTTPTTQTTPQSPKPKPSKQSLKPSKQAPKLISPSTGPFDPLKSKQDAENALLLLWAIVDVLKKGALAVDMESVASVLDEKKENEINIDEVLEGTEDLDLGNVRIVALKESQSDEKDAVEQVADEANILDDGSSTTTATATATMEDSQQAKELSILTPLSTLTLLNLLQIIQSIESLLREKFISITSEFTKETIPISPRPTDGDNPTYGIHSTDYDSFILDKISMGWGVVGMVLETETKGELMTLVETQKGLWEGRNSKEGFIVGSLLKVLEERGGWEVGEVLKV